MLSFLYVNILLQCIHFSLNEAQCENRCSQHGICGVDATCTCFSGFEGSDCSKKICPMGHSFADVATSEDIAHSLVPCSGQGVCDTKAGVCHCKPGYTGHNCQKPSCPRNCNDHGVCTSLSEAARTYNGWSLNHTTTYTLWDAEVSFGCVCDPGWSGHDCSLKICDTGADPRNFGSASETVTLVCDASASFYGRFKLRFMGRTSKVYLTGSSTALEVANAIMGSGGYYSSDGASSYAPVKVLIGGSANPALTVCDASTTTVTTIQFVRKSGDLPAVSFYQNRMVGATLYFQVCVIFA